MAIPTESEQKEKLATPEIKSNQSKILVIESFLGNCWVIDSATHVSVYNNQALMTEYKKLLTKISGSTSNGIFSGKEKVRHWLAFKGGSKDLVLNLQNVYYLP